MSSTLSRKKCFSRKVKAYLKVMLDSIDETKYYSLEWKSVWYDDNHFNHLIYASSGRAFKQTFKKECSEVVWCVLQVWYIYKKRECMRDSGVHLFGWDLGVPDSFPLLIWHKKLNKWVWQGNTPSWRAKINNHYHAHIQK